MQRKLSILICTLFFVLSSCASQPTATPDVQIEIASLELQASQITLSLDDMPQGFIESRFEGDSVLGEENLLDVQSAFSFQADRGNLQKIVGMVTVYPYSQRSHTDRLDLLDQQIELVTRSLVKGLVFTRNVEVEDFVFDRPVGDVYSAKTFKWSNADVGYPEYHTRTEILVFERNKITVILLFQYIDELPVSISITRMAEMLDQQIQDFGRND